MKHLRALFMFKKAEGPHLHTAVAISDGPQDHEIVFMSQYKHQEYCPLQHTPEHTCEL